MGLTLLCYCSDNGILCVNVCWNALIFNGSPSLISPSNDDDTDDNDVDETDDDIDTLSRSVTEREVERDREHIFLASMTLT